MRVLALARSVFNQALAIARNITHAFEIGDNVVPIVP
ncbi:hypothetical protein OROGR_004314 [Orobanche gracilis]